jgi:3-hydroxybutyrate dehydrogenase
MERHLRLNNTHKELIMGKQHDHKIALVTGSTSGIGRAIAQKFSNEGMIVAINGFGKEEDINAQLKGMHEGSDYFSADLMKKDDCKALVERVYARYGRLDILVNNAGLQHVSPIEDFPDDKWEAVISLDLSASFYTIKTALPLMRKNNWGRIINIASTHGLVASVHKAGYVAAKHGLIGLTKVTALETAGENITCNAICPGFVYTPLVEAQISAKAKEHGVSFEDEKIRFIAEKHPSKTFVDMEDLAGLAFFLSGDGAKEIRGSAYVIDGGWSAV